MSNDDSRLVHVETFDIAAKVCYPFQQDSRMVIDHWCSFRQTLLNVYANG